MPSVLTIYHFLRQPLYCKHYLGLIVTLQINSDKKKKESM